MVTFLRSVENSRKLKRRTERQLLLGLMTQISIYIWGIY